MMIVLAQGDRTLILLSELGACTGLLLPCSRQPALVVCC